MQIKKIIVVSFLLSAVFFSFSTSVAQAAVPPEENPMCWTKDDCKDAWDLQFSKLGSTFDPKTNYVSPDPGNQCGKDRGLCLPAGQSSVQITIGGNTKFSDVGDYFKKIYLYLLYIGGTVAAVIMMAGGFRWATSAGSPDKVKSAQGNISGGLLGLVLLLGSYTLLYTINPDLVNLRLPRTYMIRPIVQQGEQSGDYCDTTAGSDTRKSCEAKGGACMPLPDSDWGPCQQVEKFMGNVVAALVGGAAGGSAAGGTTIGETAAVAPSFFAKVARSGASKVGNFLVPAKYVFKGASGGTIALNVIKVGGRWIRLGVEGAVLGTAAVAVEAVTGVGENATSNLGDAVSTFFKGGHVGICTPKGGTLQKGDLCDRTLENCAKPLKCIKTDNTAMMECWGGTPGFCSDGDANASCSSNDDCNSGLICRPIPGVGSGENIKQCSNNTPGQPCKENSDCSPLVCFNYVCMAEENSNIVTGATCSFDQNCESNNCVTPVDDCWSFDHIKASDNPSNVVKGVCSDHYPVTDFAEKSQIRNNLKVWGLFPDSCVN